MNVESAKASPERLRLLMVAACLLLAFFVPYYVATVDLGWPIPRDGTSLVVGRDFLNFWMYGRAAAAADPARFYDLATYWAATEPLTGTPYPEQLWSYPPHVMLLAAPFGQLPYLAALALWTMLGMLLFLLALRLWTRDWRLILPLLFAPAAVFGIMSGQFAYVAAAAVLTVLRWRDRRPIVAGILLGLLTMKPQLGLFFPIMLLALRNWRVILAATATAGILAAITAALWGVEIWTVYLHKGIANQSMVLADPEKLGGPFMPTVFMNARLAGASSALAMAIQFCASAAAAIAVAWTFRKRPDPNDLTANGTFLAAMVYGTPYMLSYDSLSLATAAALFFVTRGAGNILPLLVYLLPLFQLTGLPGPALIPILFALWLLRKRQAPLHG